MVFEKVLVSKYRGKDHEYSSQLLQDLFKISEKHGIDFCKSKGWEVDISNRVLNVKASGLFEFEFFALIN